MENTYKPIACSYHDLLLDLSTTNTKVKVVYQSGNNSLTTESVIKDIYTKQKAEWMQLKNGILIRLDQILSVNGLENSGGSCSI